MAAAVASPQTNEKTVRDKITQDYRKKLTDHKEIDGRLKESIYQLR